MSTFTPLKPPSGAALSIAAHVGPAGSIVVNNDTKTIHVQDGINPGGTALAKVGHQHAYNEVVSWIGFTPLNAAVVGQASGVAPLGADGLVPAQYLPENTGGGGSGGVSDAGQLLGDTLATNVIHSSLTSLGVLDDLTVNNPIAGSVSGNAGSADKLSTSRNLSFTGAATGSASFDGSDDASVALTLATVNSAPVSDGFMRVTTNAQGLTVATSPVQSLDIVNVLGFMPVAQSYVDGVASNFTQRPGVRFGTTTAVGGTYNNGTDGTDATLSGSGAVPAIGGGTPSVGDRVALMGEVNKTRNGIYKLTQANPWVLTRDGGLDDVKNGAMVLVAEGDHANEKWIQITANPITIGTSQLEYTLFQAAATAYSAGAGVNIDNNNKITNTGVLAVAGTTNQIAAALANGTVTLSLAPSVTISGTMTAGSFAGSGANLTGLNAANVTTGILSTARLGTGSANANTALYGDGTWKAVVASIPGTITTSPIFNGQVSLNTGVAGVQLGRNGGGSSNDSQILMTNSAAAANQKLTRLTTVYGNGANGDFIIDMVDDAYSTGNPFMRVSRTGNTPNVMTLTAATINLNGAVSGTSFTGDGSGLTNVASAKALVAPMISGTAVADIVTAGMGGNDYFRIRVGATATDGGWAEIATADGGNEAIYVRQYSGSYAFTSITNSATLLDSSGNTSFPKTVTAAAFSGSGAALTALNAANLSTGTVPVARLGSGTASSSTVLYGDNVWRAPTATLLQLGNGQIKSGSWAVTSSNDGYVFTGSGNGRFGFSASTGYVDVYVDGSVFINEGNEKLLSQVGFEALTSVNGSKITNLNAANLTTGQVPVARMGTGTPSASTVLYGDGTWKTLATSTNLTGGTAGQIPFQSAPSTTAFGAFKWTDSSYTLTLGDPVHTNGSVAAITAANATDYNPNHLKITAGDVNTLPGAGYAGAYLLLRGGNLSGGNNGTGSGAGHVYVRGGTSNGIGSSGWAGNAYIDGGISTTAATRHGTIFFRVGNPSSFSADADTGSSSLVENLRIIPGGAWGLSGANYGTAGQVLTSSGPSAPPTWQTAPGGGTASSLTGTGTVTLSTTSGAYAGAGGGGGMLALVTSNPGAGNRLSTIVANSAGSILWSLADDTNSSSTPFFNVTRSGNTASAINITATTINLNGATTATTLSSGNVAVTATTVPANGLYLPAANTLGFATNSGLAMQINSSNAVGFGGANYGSAGQVLTSNGSTAAPTWQTPTGGSGTFLNGTATPARTGATSGAYVGTDSSSQPIVSLVNQTNGTNTRASTIYYAGDGAIRWDFSNDTFTTGSSWLIAQRGAGNVASLITLTSTGLNLAVGTSGLQLNGSAGTAGQVLTSQGNGAAPTWTTITATVGNTVQASAGSTMSLVGGAAASATSASGNVAVYSPSGGGTSGNSGQITITTGDTTNGASGQITIRTGSLTAGSGSGALLFNTGGAGPTGASGRIDMYTGGGGSTSGNSGLINFYTGTTTSGASGAFLISTGNAAGAAGNITLTAGASSTGAAGGSISFIAGNSTTAANAGVISFTTATVERLRFLANGAWSVGSNGTSTGTAGQVLTSNGASAAPTWQTVTASLPATVTSSPIFNGQVSANSTTAGVQIGRNGGGSSNDAQILMTNPAAAANQKLTRINSVFGSGFNGDFVIDMLDDAYTASNPFFRVTRSGNVPGTMTLTSATINLAGLATGGLQINGSAGTAGQVLQSNGPSAAPTWVANVATVTQIPRVTTFDATAKGKRVAVTANFTVPNNTYTPGDYFSFYNDSATDITITPASGLTMWLDGTSLTGARTLRARGTCSLWFNSATEAVIGGSLT